VLTLNQIENGHLTYEDNNDVSFQFFYYEPTSDKNETSDFWPGKTSSPLLI
jgi:hypothetical protein